MFDIADFSYSINLLFLFHFHYLLLKLVILFWLFICLAVISLQMGMQNVGNGGQHSSSNKMIGIDPYFAIAVLLNLLKLCEL